MKSIFPLRLAITGVLLLGILISSLLYGLFDAQALLERFHRVDIPTLEMSAIAVNMSDSISRKVQTIAATGDAATISEYRFEREGLAAHLEEFRNQINLQGLQQLPKDHFDRSSLNQLEDQIISFARSGDTKSALQLLNSQEFMELNESTSRAVQDVLEFNAKLRDEALSAESRQLYFFLVLSFVLCGLIGLVWMGVWRAYRFNVNAKVEAEKNLELERSRSVQNAKLATLGEMAGGIAHEINNPLAIIQGHAEQLIRMLEAGRGEKEQHIAKIQKIVTTSERIAKIIRGLRSFSRSADNDPFVATSVKSLIQESVDLANGILSRHGVELRQQVPEADLTIECRSVQISQILLNLIGNGADAVKALPEKWIDLSVHEDGDEVVISVTDSGSGIPAEVAEKIFQPFFTTKKIGEGTGLGLSISIGIAKDHNGSLSLDKESRHTRFVLRLPKTQIKSAQAAA